MQSVDSGKERVPCTESPTIPSATTGVKKLGDGIYRRSRRTEDLPAEPAVSMWERGFGFPRFKKLGRMRSFVFPQMSIADLAGDSINLPKIGRVRMIFSRPPIDLLCNSRSQVAASPIPEGFDKEVLRGKLPPQTLRLKQARIVSRASGYYVMLSLQCDVQVPDIIPLGEPIGIDVGLNSFVATSSGELIARPRFRVDASRKLKLLSEFAV